LPVIFWRKVARTFIKSKSPAISEKIKTDCKRQSLDYITVRKGRDLAAELSKATPQLLDMLGI